MQGLHTPLRHFFFLEREREYSRGRGVNGVSFEPVSFEGRWRWEVEEGRVIVHYSPLLVLSMLRKKERVFGMNSSTQPHTQNTQELEPFCMDVVAALNYCSSGLLLPPTFSCFYCIVSFFFFRWFLSFRLIAKLLGLPYHGFSEPQFRHKRFIPSVCLCLPTYLPARLMIQQVA